MQVFGSIKTFVIIKGGFDCLMDTLLNSQKEINVPDSLMGGLFTFKVFQQ